MKTTQLIEKSTNGPVTRTSLTQNLSDLGIESGDVLIVHSSLSSLGWVCGGAVAVVQALQDAVGTGGTIVMPTHSGDLSDPSGWENPAVPEEWWDTVAQEMPAYDPRITPTRGMGIIPELFRTFPEVVRSNHPQVSFAACGALAREIVLPHPLSPGFGDSSPLGRLYELEGKVLLLGVGYECNTVFHLAEYRAKFSGKAYISCSSPIITGSRKKWKHFEDIDYNDGDFSSLGRDFEKKYVRLINMGTTGYGISRVFPVKECVDFAEDWFPRHRHQ